MRRAHRAWLSDKFDRVGAWRVALQDSFEYGSRSRPKKLLNGRARLQLRTATLEHGFSRSGCKLEHSSCPAFVLLLLEHSSPGDSYLSEHSSAPKASKITADLLVLGMARIYYVRGV